LNVDEQQGGSHEELLVLKAFTVETACPHVASDGDRFPSDSDMMFMAEATVPATAGIRSPGAAHLWPGTRRPRTRQKIMVVKVFGYAYLVPFVEEEDHFFLKTIIPSRKATRDFIAQESDDV
jgi:hypothetical protein